MLFSYKIKNVQLLNIYGSLSFFFLNVNLIYKCRIVRIQGSDDLESEANFDLIYRFH